MNVFTRRFDAMLGAALLIFCPLIFSFSIRAQDDKTEKSTAKSTLTATVTATTDKAAEVAAPPPDSTTQGAIDVGGQHIAYTAVAGTITVGSTDDQDSQLGPDGKPQPGSQLALNAPASAKDATPVAQMFYVAYFKAGAKAEDRPITFLYNGGPGSATVWLHMGSLGPKHVVTAGDTHLPAAPYTMVDNPNSLLDVSDLVFIDAPGTGFGQLMGSNPDKAFWGIDGDANAYARFIQRFISEVWAVELLEVSFRRELRNDAVGGACRSARKQIHDRHQRCSAAVADLQFHNRYRPAHEQSRSRFAIRAGPADFCCDGVVSQKLPNQPAALEPFLKEVEEFTMGPYSHALALGTDVSTEEKAAGCREAA